MACFLGLHQWSDWEEVAPCTSQRHCLRNGCDKEETVIKHDYELTGYGNNCYELYRCKRCGENKKGDQKHAWSEFQYYEKRCCTQRSVCGRCGAAKYQEDCHQDETYEPKDRCETHTVCTRCDRTLVRSRKHNWKSGVDTYMECLHYALDQYTYRSDKAKTSMTLGLDSINETRNHADEIASIGLRQSKTNARIQDAEKMGERDVPAKVCATCLFVVKTGRRPTHVDTGVSDGGKSHD